MDRTLNFKALSFPSTSFSPSCVFRNATGIPMVGAALASAPDGLKTISPKVTRITTKHGIRTVGFWLCNVSWNRSPDGFRSRANKSPQLSWTSDISVVDLMIAPGETRNRLILSTVLSGISRSLRLCYFQTLIRRTLYLQRD